MNLFNRLGENEFGVILQYFWSFFSSFHFLTKESNIALLFDWLDHLQIFVLVCDNAYSQTEEKGKMNKLVITWCTKRFEWYRLMRPKYMIYLSVWEKMLHHLMQHFSDFHEPLVQIPRSILLDLGYTWLQKVAFWKESVN